MRSFRENQANCQFALHFSDEIVMAEAKHLTMAELEAGLDTIRQAPKDKGVIALIVRRPQIDARDVLEEGKLDWSKVLWATVGKFAAATGHLMGWRIPTCNSISCVSLEICHRGHDWLSARL